MTSRKFRRFVAAFVGLILAADLALVLVTGEETLLGSTLALGGLYIVYLVFLIKKEKEDRAKEKKPAQSPLMRR